MKSTLVMSLALIGLLVAMATSAASARGPQKNPVFVTRDYLDSVIALIRDEFGGGTPRGTATIRGTWDDVGLGPITVFLDGTTISATSNETGTFVLENVPVGWWTPHAVFSDGPPGGPCWGLFAPVEVSTPGQVIELPAGEGFTLILCPSP